MGCGSGRWATIISPKVKKIVCIDASLDAINIAKENLKNMLTLSIKLPV
jgi:methylase of polypeptide subunit release factors